MPSGSAGCLATVSGTRSAIAMCRRSNVLPCAILRRSGPSREQSGTSWQTETRPLLWAGPAWKCRSASLWQTEKRTSTRTSPASFRSCWVGRYCPFWFEPLSSSHLLGPQAGRTEEQRSSAMTMTTWLFGSLAQAIEDGRWRQPITLGTDGSVRAPAGCWPDWCHATRSAGWMCRPPRAASQPQGRLLRALDTRPRL